MTAARYGAGPPGCAISEGDTRSLSDLYDETMAVCPGGKQEGQGLSLFNAGVAAAYRFRSHTA